MLAGLFVLGSGFLAWLNVRVAQRNLVISQEGQITDRFTKAIEQLGATHPRGKPHIELRLGGIYALERIPRIPRSGSWRY